MISCKSSLQPTAGSVQGLPFIDGAFKESIYPISVQSSPPPPLLLYNPSNGSICKQGPPGTNLVLRCQVQRFEARQAPLSPQCVNL